MNQAEANAVQVRFTAGDIPKFNAIAIEACYIVFTGTEVVTGPAGIAKVYGIPSGSIAKKYGTNWSDIKEIYGII